MNFNYIARTKKGEIQNGTIKASSQEGALAVLQGQDLIVVSIQASEGIPVWLRQIKIFQRIKQKEVVNFSRQLSILVSAKVPLVQALQALAKQQQNPLFRETLFMVAHDVESGLIFSKALGKHSKQFSPFYINLIKSGEVSGNLENTLKYLADHLENQYSLMMKVRNAMMYPAFITLGFIIVAVLMMIFVIPNLISILEETGQELPLITRMIIGISRFFQNWWWIILLVLIGAGAGAWQYVRTPQGRRIFDGMKLKIPIFGSVFQKVYLARFTENLSTLVKGGLPILQSLQVSSDVVGNVIFTELLLEAKEGVRVGNTISFVFEQHPEIPSMVTQMISTGEKTGSLDFVLQKIADYYNQEVDGIVSTLSSLIEPVLIILLGVGVAVLLTAILLPIYNIAGGM